MALVPLPAPTPGPLAGTRDAMGVGTLETEAAATGVRRFTLPDAGAAGDKAAEAAAAEAAAGVNDETGAVGSLATVTPDDERVLESGPRSCAAREWVPSWLLAPGATLREGST